MKRRPRLRALVLAAGRGERLRPLTGFMPKPLLPVAGQPLVTYALRRLASVGCEATALNLHHLGEQIERRLGDRFDGLPLTYSREPILLGTLGALRPLREFLAEADLIVILNSDSLCRWPLRSLIRRHQKTGARATLLLARDAPVATHGGGVGLEEGGRIVDFRGRIRPQAERRFVFAGAHVLAPELLERLPDEDGPSDIVGDLYLPLLAAGERLESVVTTLPWHDLGTPGRYLEGVREWARGRWPRRLWRGRWIARSARLERRVRVRRSVIEGGCRIGPGSEIEGSLLLGGVELGRGSHVSGSIVAPGVSLPHDTWVERRLVTPLKAGRDPGANDSVVGDLVYTPIRRPDPPAATTP